VRFNEVIISPKPLHRPLSSSKWLMRILRSIVETTANNVAIGNI
jgi:hypothetical protein